MACDTSFTSSADSVSSFNELLRSYEDPDADYPGHSKIFETIKRNNPDLSDEILIEALRNKEPPIHNIYEVLAVTNPSHFNEPELNNIIRNMRSNTSGFIWDQPISSNSPTTLLDELKKIKEARMKITDINLPTENLDILSNPILLQTDANTIDQSRYIFSMQMLDTMNLPDINNNISESELRSFASNIGLPDDASAAEIFRRQQDIFNGPPKTSIQQQKEYLGLSEDATRQERLAAIEVVRADSGNLNLGSKLYDTEDLLTNMVNEDIGITARRAGTAPQYITRGEMASLYQAARDGDESARSRMASLTPRKYSGRAGLPPIWQFGDYRAHPSIKEWENRLRLKQILQQAAGGAEKSLATLGRHELIESVGEELCLAGGPWSQLFCVGIELASTGITAYYEGHKSNICDRSFFSDDISETLNSQNLGKVCELDEHANERGDCCFTLEKPDDSSLYCSDGSNPSTTDIGLPICGAETSYVMPVDCSKAENVTRPECNKLRILNLESKSTFEMRGCGKDDIWARVGDVTDAGRSLGGGDTVGYSLGLGDGETPHKTAPISTTMNSCDGRIGSGGSITGEDTIDGGSCVPQFLEEDQNFIESVDAGLHGRGNHLPIDEFWSNDICRSNDITFEESELYNYLGIRNIYTVENPYYRGPNTTFPRYSDEVQAGTEDTYQPNQTTWNEELGKFLGGRVFTDNRINTLIGLTSLSEFNRHMEYMHPKYGSPPLIPPPFNINVDGTSMTYTQYHSQTGDDLDSTLENGTFDPIHWKDAYYMITNIPMRPSHINHLKEYDTASWESQAGLSKHRDGSINPSTGNRNDSIWTPEAITAQRDRDIENEGNRWKIIYTLDIPYNAHIENMLTPSSSPHLDIERPDNYARRGAWILEGESSNMGVTSLGYRFIVNPEKFNVYRTNKIEGGCDPGLMAALGDNLPWSVNPYTAAEIGLAWGAQEGHSSINRECTADETNLWLDNIPLQCNKDGDDFWLNVDAAIRSGADVDTGENGCVMAALWDDEFGDYDQNSMRNMNGTYTEYHNLEDEKGNPGVKKILRNKSAFDRRGTVLGTTTDLFEAIGAWAGGTGASAIDAIFGSSIAADCRHVNPESRGAGGGSYNMTRHLKEFCPIAKYGKLDANNFLVRKSIPEILADEIPYDSGNIHGTRVTIPNLNQQECTAANFDWANGKCTTVVHGTGECLEGDENRCYEARRNPQNINQDWFPGMVNDCYSKTCCGSWDDNNVCSNHLCYGCCDDRDDFSDEDDPAKRDIRTKTLEYCDSVGWEQGNEGHTGGGSTQTVVPRIRKSGCMDSDAVNYNPTAVEPFGDTSTFATGQCYPELSRGGGPLAWELNKNIDYTSEEKNANYSVNSITPNRYTKPNGVTVNQSSDAGIVRSNTSLLGNNSVNNMGLEVSIGLHANACADDCDQMDDCNAFILDYSNINNATSATSCKLIKEYEATHGNLSSSNNIKILGHLTAKGPINETYCDPDRLEFENKQEGMLGCKALHPRGNYQTRYANWSSKKAHHESCSQGNDCTSGQCVDKPGLFTGNWCNGNGVPPVDPFAQCTVHNYNGMTPFTPHSDWTDDNKGLLAFNAQPHHSEITAYDWNKRCPGTDAVSCNTTGTWYNPLGSRTSETSWQNCRQRALDEGMPYFNYFSNGGCHPSTGNDESTQGQPGRTPGSNPTRLSGLSTCI
jgi:hypothetical protein